MKMLEETCYNIPKPPHTNHDDSKAICSKVVVENGDDLIDALSTGEDKEWLCRDQGLCTYSWSSNQQMIENEGKRREAEAKQREEAQKKAKEDKHNEEDEDDLGERSDIHDL